MTFYIIFFSFIAFIALITASCNTGIVRIISLIILFASGYGVYYYYTFSYTKAIDKALSVNDFEKANELLVEMSEDEAETSEGYFWSKHPSKYSMAFEKVFKTQITYLINQGDPTSCDKIVNIINALPCDANPFVGETSDNSVFEANDLYGQYVGKFNNICEEVFSTAISRKNRYLAEKIIPLYKPTLKKSTTKSNWFSSDEIKFELCYDVKDDAKNRLEIAVKNHVFD